MTSLKLALAASLSTLALASTASAGGMAPAVVEPAQAPVPAPAPVVYGSDWTGFYAGAQVGYGKSKSPAFSQDIDGAVYGVHAGYNYDFGQYVLGGEVDYDKTNISDAAGSGIELDSVARLKLRAGYDAGSFLPYFTAGVAQAKTTGSLAATDTGNFYGLGVDYMVSPNVMVGGEVLKHKFSNFDNSGADVDATTLTARVSFKF